MDETRTVILAGDRQRFLVCSSVDELTRTAADFFVTCAAESVRRRGRFAVALAGGSTPLGLYRLLADDPALREAVSWRDVHVFWGDERHVPPSHDDSNYRMACVALVGRVPIPPLQVHRIEAEGRDAERVALAYEQTLRTTFDLAEGGWPSFDLILLGMGKDGHTASLFPGSAAVHEQVRLVVAPFVDRVAARRITLTPPVVVRARDIAVLVTGAEKAQTLRDALEGPIAPDRCPIQILRTSVGTVTWFIDAPAATALTSGDFRGETPKLPGSQ